MSIYSCVCVHVCACVHVCSMCVCGIYARMCVYARVHAQLGSLLTPFLSGTGRSYREWMALCETPPTASVQYLEIPQSPGFLARRPVSLSPAGQELLEGRACVVFLSVSIA